MPACTTTPDHADPSANHAPPTFPDAVRLSNGTIDVAVAPSVGRIVHFGPAGGRNLLWLNTVAGADEKYEAHGRSYSNIGGDKLWPTVQTLWPQAYGGGPWPPDGIIDGGPWWLVERSDRHVVIESRRSPHLGVVVRREVRLPDRGASLTIINRTTRVADSPFGVTNWTVTQTQRPRYVLLDAGRPTGPPGPWIGMSEARKLDDLVKTIEDAQAVAWTPTQSGGAKIGALGAWVAGVYNDVIFLQRTRFDPAAEYPDGSSVQVYSDDNYTELELLSPFVPLDVGSTLTNTVTWSLLPLSQPVEPEEASRRIREAAER